MSVIMLLRSLGYRLTLAEFMAEFLTE